MIAMDVFGATGEQSKTCFGLAIRLTFIALETFALAWKGSGFQQA